MSLNLILVLVAYALMASVIMYLGYRAEERRWKRTTEFIKECLTIVFKSAPDDGPDNQSK